MEELAPILWILIAAGVLLSKSSKVRKAARKAAKELEEQGGEAWPSWDAEAQPAQRQGSPAAADAPAAESDHSVFGPVARQVTAARTTAVNRKKTKHAVQAPAPIRQPHSAQEPAEPAESPSDEGFDLRRAIIYSEILKPKFDE